MTKTLLLAFIACLIFSAGIYVGSQETRDQALDRGFATTDPKTGDFHWKDACDD